MNFKNPDLAKNCPRTSVFAFLWAVATIFHHLSSNYLSTLDLTSAESTVEFLSMFSIVPVLIYPGRYIYLASMAALHLISFWMQMPLITNHTIVLGLVNLGILLGAPKRWRESAPWFDGARIVLVVLYFSAALHKFNSDYLFSNGSCARLVVMEVQQYLGVVLPDSLLKMAGPSSWFVEALLAVILLIPRTARFGVILAIIFHWILALDGLKVYHNFSAPVFAILSCFLPDTFAKALGFNALNSRERPNYLLGSVISLSFIVLIAGRYQWITISFDQFRIAGQILWLGLSAPFIYLLIRDLIKSQETSPAIGMSLVSVVLFCLAFLNGLSPILGIKTGSGFDMYSNLKLERGESNHLLIKDAPDLFGWRSDLVTLHATSLPGLQNVIQRGLRVPFIELRRALAEQPDASITYSRNNQLFRVDRVDLDPQLSKPIPYPVKKFVFFRPVNQLGDPTCTW